MSTAGDILYGAIVYGLLLASVLLLAWVSLVELGRWHHRRQQARHEPPPTPRQGRSRNKKEPNP